MILQSSPHLRDHDNVSRIMVTVCIALMPGVLAGIWAFGLKALVVTVVAVLGCLGTEAIVLRIMGKPLRPYLTDGSAVVTGLLLAMNLPSNLPWWMVVVGAVVAVVLGKQVFGGIGSNPFNPALVARVFLLISFPAAMTSWPSATGELMNLGVDVQTGATVLGALKTDGLQALMGAYPNLHLDLFLGRAGGSLGEVSALALLVGGIFLLIRRVISWHVPVSFVGSVVVITGIFWLVDSATYADPLFHVLSGGVMLGAWFMATDMVTTPVTPLGMLIFGAGCGVITCVIRLLGAYPEGVSFSILIMNGLTPLIDRYVRPPKFADKEVK
jgi:electron transport complex protein RnfD